MLLRKRTSTNGYSRSNRTTDSVPHETPPPKSVRGRRGRGRPRGSDTSSGRRSNRSAATSERSSRKTGAKSTPKPWNVSDEEDNEVAKPRWTHAATSSNADFDEFDSSGLSSESDGSNSEEEEDGFLDFDQATTSSLERREEGEEDDAIFCPWAELPPDQIAPLELPDSSTDLLIESDHLLETLEVYEVLQNFGYIIQLSPFLFEDFCCALRNQGQSKLLCEIHLALLRLFFRDEEQEQTTFCASEMSPSFNIILQLLDHMSYAEVLRHYLESDEYFPREVLDIVEHSNYPFVPLDKRLTVLRWMCQRLFETNIFKKALKAGTKIKHNTHCRRCGKAGGSDLMPCAGCEAVYHSQCADADELDEQQQQQQQFWICEICRRHQVRGSTDCLLPGQTNLRKSPLGYDRNGRIYWFLVRRIFIYAPATNDVYYYSTLPQLYELICSLDPGHFEHRLCRTLAELLPDIAVQMHNTLELTDERRQQLQQRTQKETAEPYLHVNNGHLMCKIMAKIRGEQENGVAKVKIEPGNGLAKVKTEPGIGWAQVKREQDSDDDEENDHEEEEAASMDILQMVRHLLCIHRGKLEANFWSGGLDEHQLLLNHKIWSSAMETDAESFEALTADLDVRMRRGMRLGFSDAGHRTYVNHYSSNDLAKSPYARSKEKERRRYLNTKFCLTDEGEFTWPNQKGAYLFGSEQEVLKCVLLSLRRLVDRIPEGLMHRRWVLDSEKQHFLQRLQNCADVGTLRELLLLFERAIRKPAFLNVWWGGLALTRLNRCTSELRELRQKIENAKRREEKTLASADPADDQSDIVWVKYSLLGGPPKHNIWKMREGNEQFRVNGMGALGGWLWVSSNLVRSILPLTEKPDIQQHPNSVSSRKSARLRRISNKLLMWRTVEELGNQAPADCYSPNCRLIRRSCSANSPVLSAFCPFHFSPQEQGFLLPCYNAGCKRNRPASPPETAQCVRAKAPAANRRSSSLSSAAADGSGVLGEDLPFPFPKPCNFKHKTSGKYSILVLPRWCLKRLARQGGLNPKTIAPGFHPLAKGNPLAWPYPCPRPLFEHCWRFLTTKATSLHALVLRFRQMYASIRWMDLWPEDPDDPDNRIWSHHPDHDEVRTVIGHRENPPDGYYEQYKIRVDQYPLSMLDEEDGGQFDDNDYDFRHPGGQRKKRGGGGTRKRPRYSEDEEQRQRRMRLTSVEQWIDGVDLKLYEIEAYWHDYLQRQLDGQRQQQQQFANQVQQKQPSSSVLLRLPLPTPQQQRQPLLNRQQQQQVIVVPAISSGQQQYHAPPPSQYSTISHPHHYHQQPATTTTIVVHQQPQQTSSGPVGYQLVNGVVNYDQPLVFVVRRQQNGGGTDGETPPPPTTIYWRQ